VTNLLKNARWALWKNPDKLTEHQREQLGWIAKTNPALHRASALKEGLRTVFAIARRSPAEAVEALDRWISWGPPLPPGQLRRAHPTHRPAPGHHHRLSLGGHRRVLPAR